jgi:hypothetical protein
MVGVGLGAGVVLLTALLNLCHVQRWRGGGRRDVLRL